MGARQGLDVRGDQAGGPQGSRRDSAHHPQCKPQPSFYQQVSGVAKLEVIGVAVAFVVAFPGAQPQQRLSVERADCIAALDALDSHGQ